MPSDLTKLVDYRIGSPNRSIDSTHLGTRTSGGPCSRTLWLLQTKCKKRRHYFPKDNRHLCRNECTHCHLGYSKKPDQLPPCLNSNQDHCHLAIWSRRYWSIRRRHSRITYHLWRYHKLIYNFTNPKLRK